jgi:hypothetical protein
MGNNATETTKWPWHLTNTDVIVRDPHTGVTGEWPVIGEPQHVAGRTVVYCETEDGGEGVFSYRSNEQAVVRAHTTYTAPPLLTCDEREHALEDMADDPAKLLRFAALALAGWPEIFDAVYGRVQRHRDHAATTSRRPA